MTDIRDKVLSTAQAAMDRAKAEKLALDSSAWDGPQRDWPFLLEPVSGYVGAAIRGIDLREPLTPDVVDAVREALAHYGVVFFVDQDLAPEHHLAFARSFGAIRAPAPYQKVLDEHPQICVISTEDSAAYLTDNWHQDVSWPEAPTRYSILHMQAVPDHGGDTMWASLAMAFERLSPAMQEFLLPLTVRHAQPASPETLYFDHPLVIRHPVNGRRSIYANPIFTQRVNELTATESKALLEFLYAHAVTPEYTCRWRWRAGQIAMWDNCYVMHYALADYHPHYRKLHRIEIEGERLIAARS